MKKIFYVVCIGLLLAGCGSRDSASVGSSNTPNVVSNPARDFFAEGQALLAKGDMQGAVEIFQEGLAQDPNDSRLHFVMGQVFMRGGALGNAEQSFVAAIQADPENANAYLLLGGCFDLLGKRDDAIASVRKSVELFQKQQDAVGFRQSVAILKKMTEAAPTAP